MKRFKTIKIVHVLAILTILVACEQTNGISETVNNGDKPKSDLTSAVIPTYAISGTVSGDGKEGITITLSGDALSTIKTDGAGTYRFTSLSKGDYKVTPTLTDSTFSPVGKSVIIAGDNITGVDFLCVCDDEDNDGMCD